MRANPSKHKLTGAVAALIALAIPGTAALAVPGTAAAAASGGTSRPHPAPPPPARGVTGTHLARRACAPAATAGFAACLALVRAGIAARRGLFPAGTTPAGYGPADLQSAYNLPSATAGGGQTVAIVDAYDNPGAAADLAVYRQQYGLPPCTTANGCFRKVAQNGSTNYPPTDDTGGWEEEESLDVDMVSAICPRCHILLVEADNNALPNLGRAVDEAVRLGAKYVSNSYGGPESLSETAWDRYYDHPGVAVTASAGDTGYGVSYPAASRYVTSVGGTTLRRVPRVPRGWAETVWYSDLDALEGTGSGCSADEAKPSWQQDTGCKHRTDNDVAADADPNTGVAFYDTFGQSGWGVVGGTSVSSPVIASTFALAGAPAPGTYPSSYPYAGTSALNDVTSGANGTCAPAYLCTAGPGYDGPTGWGTPDGVGAFRDGPHGTVSGTVTSAATGRPLAGARVIAGTAAVTTDASGSYVLTVPPGTYAMIGRDWGYQVKVARGVRVAQGQTVTKNFALSTQREVTVSGTVTDGSGHGWPLAATVSVPGTPASAQTGPATGRYQLRLPAGAAYSLLVTTQYPGYRPVRRSVTVGTSGVRDNFALAADDTICRAPGYRLAGHLQIFGGTLPPGWSVVTPKGSVPWGTGEPYGLPNYTGGRDGDVNVYMLYVTPGTAEHTDLISPAVSMLADRQPILRFDQALIEAPALRVEIDLSTDGGHTWSAVWKHSGASIPGPDSQTVALPAAAGRPDVRVRFQFIDTSVSQNAEYWELDNIYLGNLPCAAIPGGLVTGQVSDGNTGAPLEGATVTSVSDPGRSTVTASTPAGRGFYSLFSPPGAGQRFAVALPRYATATAITAVRANRASAVSVALSAGRLALTPGSVSVAERMGGSKTVPVTFTNTGQAPLTVHLHQRPGTVAVLGAPDTAAGAPPVRRVGTFSPLAPATFPAARRAGAARAAGPRDTGSPWTPIAPYPVPIADPGVATDTSTGDIYSAGGFDGIYLDSGYVYSPATGSWTGLPAMRYARDAPQAAFIGGRLYITGGWGANGYPVAALEAYDPATRRWSTGASIPVPLGGASVTVADGKMYVIGGCDAHTCGYRTVQIYDPATNSWSAGAAYPTPIAWESCGTIGARIYCASGATSSTTFTGATYAYSLATNTWSRVASIGYPLWGAGYTASNGRLLVSGGVGVLPGGVEVLTNGGTAYDPATNTWTGLPATGAALYRGGSACGFVRIGGNASGQSLVLVRNAELLPEYSGCEFGHVGWLSQSKASFTLQPGQSVRVTLTLNAASTVVTQPGTYATDLVIGQDTPYPVPQVKVAMRVSPPPAWGAITGTVSGASCHGRPAPLWGASVTVATRTARYPLVTPPDGRYLLWLDSRSNPLRLTAADTGWRAQSRAARITARHMTTANFTLHPSRPCT
jgi:hypothetical protein